MDKPIIEVKNISKRYAIAHGGANYLSLRDVFATILRSPFSFLKTKAKQVAGKQKKEEFWALKDVSFTVNKGEIIGVIGRNGAGKSTLLKILTGITPPTNGEIIMRGRVASLLEVGTGFHPELTGRENIFLNGAILGMERDEISRKFDEIVAFAGIEQFLDTPVKYYSSGMYVRLGFSIAAHLEPDILLVDEVLAVGDVEFQKKCLGKMEEVTKEGGRTILFVSHNIAAIQNLCKRTILLDKGQVEAIGDTQTIIDHYLSSMKQARRAEYVFEEQSASISISSVSLLDKNNIPRSELPISEPFSIEVAFACKEDVQNVAVSALFYSGDRDLLLYSSDSDTTGTLASYAPGAYKTTIRIPPFLFNVGAYSFDILVHIPNLGGTNQKDLSFEITNIDNPRSLVFQKEHLGRIALPLSFTTSKT